MVDKMPGHVWTNEAVSLLLSLYLRETLKDRPVKLKKKDVWKLICGELCSRGLKCSWQECDKKYRNLKQTFVRNLKQVGRKQCRWMFFPIMFEINKHECFANLSSGSGSGSDNEEFGPEFNNNNNINNLRQSIDSLNNQSPTSSHSPQPSPSIMLPSNTTPNTVNHRLTHTPNLHHQHFQHQQQLTLPPPALQQQKQQHQKQQSQSSAQQYHQQQGGASDVELPSTNADMIASGESNTQQTQSGTSPSSAQDICEPNLFKAFLDEYKLNEDRKLSKIQEICDELRRSNEIEVQRNIILAEKNHLLKALLSCLTGAR